MFVQLLDDIRTNCYQNEFLNENNSCFFLDENSLNEPVSLQADQVQLCVYREVFECVLRARILLSELSEYANEVF